ncbi:nucleotidyl transferase AbiEii/AbiGii toxin family protein [Bacteroidota bacterium]
MILHKDYDILYKAIKETSDNTGIADYFIEKDYWISLVLKRLSESKYVDSVVFKGGTSLSKGFKLINRFSEDVDIAVINTSELSGNQLKSLIRTVEKEIARDLTEIEVNGVTSKGSRFRKAVYEYDEIEPSSTGNIVSNTLIVEINSFANPYPYVKVSIQSMVGEFLQKNNQNELIKKYGLEPFELYVLDKKRTLIEKIVSLIRFSFDENYIDSISSKIRHFYDIYYLLQDSESNTYFNSESFITDFTELLNHDRKAFDEPKGWVNKKLSSSPIVKEFDSIWNKIKSKYTNELSIFAYSQIPREGDVQSTFNEVVKKLKNIIDSF